MRFNSRHELQSMSDLETSAIDREAEARLRTVNPPGLKFGVTRVLPFSSIDCFNTNVARVEHRARSGNIPFAVIEQLIALSKRRTYTEIYHIYRNRDEGRMDQDRLPVSTLHADTLDEAVKKAIILAGFDEVEAKELGLDRFEAGNVMELCDRLKELTGDTFCVSSYEMPTEEN